jgi:hyperosmotically inducible periplasmic protein
MKTILKSLGMFLAMGALSAGLAAQTTSASRNDGAIQSKATQQLAVKTQFRNLTASVEDGIVTLTGNVDLYQQKLDAAKEIRKIENVQGVRNLIVVAGKTVPDANLTAQLDRKLYYDRIGYDNVFNYVTASVQDGVATLNGEVRLGIDRDSALSLVNATPGVKDVVNNVTVESILDDRVRFKAERAIYRDAVLGRYAIDPARPIRIVVDRGKLTLYGTVETPMDKQIAGVRANQVLGAFSVQNDLQVAKRS